MINVNPDTICFLIARAHQFHAKEQVVIPDSATTGTSDDWGQQVLADHANDPTLQEIQATVADLDPDQQVELVALMWVGRGDFDPSEWQDAISQAGESWTPRTAEYLISTPLVADYLQEGLSELGYQCD